jgi:hypothetical protein
MSFCPDKPILAGFSGSFAPYSFSALEGRYDGDVISLTRLPVNNPDPAIQSECVAREECCLKKGRDTVGQPPSTEIGVLNLPSWKAKKLRKLPQEKVLLEL